MSDKYEELLVAYKKEPKKRDAERMLMVYNVLHDKLGIPLVAKMFHKAYNTVKNNCNRFIKYGITGLHDAPRSGRPPKIKNETLDKYLNDPSMGDDVSELVKKIRDECGVHYTESGLRAKMHSMGMSPKLPQPAFFQRATVEYVAGWRVGIMEWLDDLKKDGFDACVADQYLIQNDYNQGRRLWSPVGTRIWRYKYPNRSQFYLFGGFTIQGRRLFRNIGAYTAENVLKVVKAMRQRWGQFGMLWDRASQHTACVVTDYLADHASDIRVQWFPTAWPDLNPVEGYWSKLARHIVMSTVFDTVDDRVKGIMNVVRHMPPNLDIEKILLRSPLVQKRPGDTKYYCLESVTEEPPSKAEIQRCKNFLT